MHLGFLKEYSLSILVFLNIVWFVHRTMVGVPPTKELDCFEELLIELSPPTSCHSPQIMSLEGEGLEFFYRTLGKTIDYPRIARKNGVKGRILVSFLVNQYGWVSEARALTHIPDNYSGKKLSDIVVVAYQEPYTIVETYGGCSLGKMALEQEALRCIRNVGPFRVSEEAFQRGGERVIIPISFELR